jgi:hypothetical protein
MTQDDVIDTQVPNSLSQSAWRGTAELKFSWPRRIRDWLWGYDFFISYHWASGGKYAVNLAQKLRMKSFDVFLDRADFASGDDWKRMGQIALRNTQRLILIATREAVTESLPVQHEVEIFTARGRQVIPIVFGDRFVDLDRAKFPVFSLLPESHLFIDSGADARLHGPSDETIDELIRTHRVLRRRSLRALISVIPVLLVIAFATFATYQWGAAVLAKHDAERSRDLERIARDKETEQRKEAQTNLAANWNMLSLSAVERENDPLTALLFACAAAEATPEDRPNLASYLNRVVQLALKCPLEVKNLPMQGNVESVAISPKFERVAIVADNGRVSVFDTRDGRMLPVPDAVVKAGDAGSVQSLALSNSGERVLTLQLWIQDQPDPDEPATAKLMQVWGCKDGVLVTPVDDGRIDEDKLIVGYFRSSDFPVFDADGRVVLDFEPSSGTLGAIWRESHKRWAWTVSSPCYMPTENDTLPPMVEPLLAISQNPNHNNVLVAHSFGENGDRWTLDILNSPSGESILTDQQRKTDYALCAAALARSGHFLVSVFKDNGAFTVRRSQIVDGSLVSIGEPVRLKEFANATTKLRIASVSDDAGNVLITRYTQPGAGQLIVPYEHVLVTFSGENGSPATTVDWTIEQPARLATFITKDGSLLTGGKSENEFELRRNQSIEYFKLSSYRGIKFDSARSRIATVDRRGTMTVWPADASRGERTRLLTAATPWLDAKWIPRRSQLVTIDAAGYLEVWQLTPTNDLNSVTRVRVAEEIKNGAMLRPTDDGSLVLIGGIGLVVYSLDDKKVRFDSKSSEQFSWQGDDFLGAGITKDGSRLLVAEQFENDLFVNCYPLQSTESEFINGPDRSARFAAFLGDASYCIVRGTTFGSADLTVLSSTTGERTASVLLPDGSALSSLTMLGLLRTATQFERVDETTARFRTRSGAWIAAHTVANRESRIFASSSQARIVSPRSSTFRDAH